eukprot:TRINITY_DN21501_c0_g1_i1.p1 TRINITY_DN21501_c0_g1~~TRINITY_DN21501_c0_g1_i1.p1  ORF type:complete len:302 (-),score=62.28 TRINITY_DN21501_c0_g1_i1:149-925(-)
MNQPDSQWSAEFASGTHAASPAKRTKADRRRVYIVGVCGPSCGGKSTLARKLGDMLDSPAHPVPLDAYFQLEHIHEDPNFGKNWERPQGVDFERLRTDIEAMAQTLATASTMPSVLLDVDDPRQGHVHILRDEWQGRDLSDMDQVVLLAEGFLLFHDPKLCSLFDAMVWVEADGEVCCRRRHARDGQHLSAEEFDRWYYGMVWSHFEMYRDVQLTNASSALRLNGDRQLEELADEAFNFCRRRLGLLDEASTADEEEN